eukprot:g62301.t1
MVCRHTQYGEPRQVRQELLNQTGRAARVSGMIYPPSPNRAMASSLLSWVFMLGLIILFAGEAIFKTLKFEPGLKLVKALQENQVVTIALLFACNFLATNLVNTGAFEVYMNDELVWSKIQTGQLPDAAVLLKEFARISAGNAYDVRSHKPLTWGGVVLKRNTFMFLLLLCLLHVMFNRK